MTAVEWLVDQLFSDNVIFGVSKELFDQAKEMEKERIKKERVEAYNNGYANGQNDAYAN